MSLGREVGLAPGNIVLDGGELPPSERGTASPTFRPMSIVAKRSPISVTAQLLILLSSVTSIIPPAGVRPIKVFGKKFGLLKVVISLYVWLGQCTRALVLEGTA